MMNKFNNLMISKSLGQFAVCFFVLLSLQVAKAETKVGLINIKLIMNQIDEGKNVNVTLEKSFKGKESILKSEEAKIKKLQEELVKQDMVLSDKAKMTKQKEIQEAIGAYQKKTMDFQKQIQKEEADLKKPILDKLSKIVEKISADAGVDVTYEISSNPLVYAKTKEDLNQKVIELYNKENKSSKK
jgi:outer membrane protein